MATNLKQLKLPHSVVSEKRLKAIFGSAAHLGGLESDLHYNCAGSGTAYCEGKELMDVLSQISETLRRLKFTVEMLQSWNRNLHVNCGVETTIGSMKCFKKLE